jgi:hypothetical protein
MADESGFLYLQCADIDLDQIYRGGYDTPHRVRDFGCVSRDQLSYSCQLCRMIAETLYRLLDDTSLAAFHEGCGCCEFADSEPATCQLFAVTADQENNKDAIGYSKSAGYMERSLLRDTVYDDVGFSKSRKSSHEKPVDLSPAAEDGSSSC